MNLKKKIEYNVCPWCEDEPKWREHCRKTFGHAKFQLAIAWRDLFNEIIKPLKQLFRL